LIYKEREKVTLGIFLFCSSFSGEERIMELKMEDTIFENKTLKIFIM